MCVGSPDRAGKAATDLFARVAAAHDCLEDDACKHKFASGSDVEGYQPSLAEAVQRHYYPENFPFEPFGAVFEDAADAERRDRFHARQRVRTGWQDPNVTLDRAVEAPPQDKDEV